MRIFIYLIIDVRNTPGDEYTHCTGVQMQILFYFFMTGSGQPKWNVRPAAQTVQTDIFDFHFYR